MTKAKVLKDIENIKKNMQQIIKEIEKIARDVVFIQRQGKIQAWAFLYLCTFSGLDVSKTTLVAMSANLSSKVATDISTQAIDQRLNDKGVCFLQEIFTRLLNSVSLSDSKISSA
ncbi:hypothetical protein [Wukongibacter sp. M2B1]|uniref:hypothetical protein n=1 Tax=Wukongibacter sp. M2B1 TaxID=3088895 RepID=UPI003D7BCC47